MASVQTVKGVSQTAIDAGGLSNQLAAGLKDGRVKVCHDSYTADGSESAGSTIEFGGNLPAGAKILGIIMSVGTAQSSLTFALGTSYNIDEFAVAGNTTLQAALTALFSHGKGYVVGTAALDSQIVLTTAAATMTAGIYYCTILYTTD